jgi:hypothetical protein
MPDVLRYFAFALIIIVPAVVISWFTVGLGRGFSFFAKKQKEAVSPPRYFINIKYASLLVGALFGVWYFWAGFGIGMCSSEHDSPWVMNYVYYGLLPIIPLVIVGYLIPWVGGFALLCNTLWVSHLLRKVWANPISFASKDEIFRVRNGVYDLGWTIFSFAVPMMILSLFLLFIAWKERSISLAIGQRDFRELNK